VAVSRSRSSCPSAGTATISTFLRYDIASASDKRKALRDTETFIRLDRAEREALNAQKKLGPPDDSPAAKKRTKTRTKSKGARPGKT